MDEKIVFLANGKINVLQNDKIQVLNSSIAENYIQKQKEISKRNEWKRSGTGATFMGVSYNRPESEAHNQQPDIEGFARYGKERIAYSLNTGMVGGIYIKDISNPGEQDTYILVKEKIRLFDLDVNDDNKIIVSAADNLSEKHLAVITADNNDLRTLTEGDSYDNNPKWSRKSKDIIYYDSCGLGYDSNGNFVQYGPRGIYRLNAGTGDLDEVFSGEQFDFYNPYEDENGDLFYIKRPYNLNRNKTMPLKDILLIPFKLLGAIFGWLNFFTQRYSGESLKTNGNNPAKTQRKSPEQMFVDGNLLEAEKNLRINEAAGEKNPGYAPASWQLMVRKLNGEEKVCKKGVLDYCVMNDNSIVYSNGKYIIKIHEDGTEEAVGKVNLASGLISFGDV